MGGGVFFTLFSPISPNAEHQVPLVKQTSKLPLSHSNQNHKIIYSLWSYIKHTTKAVYKLIPAYRNAAKPLNPIYTRYTKTLAAVCYETCSGSQPCKHKIIDVSACSNPAAIHCYKYPWGEGGRASGGGGGVLQLSGRCRQSRMHTLNKTYRWRQGKACNFDVRVSTHQ